MRITMICIGSTGDVMPYIVLGRELKARGHEITICAFSDFASKVADEGMIFSPISGSVKVFMTNIMKPGVNGVGFLKQVRDTLAAIIRPFLADLEAACVNAEAIIATFFGQIIQSIAEVNHVPFIQTHYFPMDNNKATPISSAPGQNAGKAWNITSYQLGYTLISTMEKYYLSEWREERGMAPRKMEHRPNYEINGHIVPVIYAFSPLIMPRPTDWGENIHLSGYWSDDKPVDFQPDPSLVKFLQEGEKPIYIGFGSMTGNDMGETLDIVLEALQQTGMRAILATGWGGVDVPNHPNLYVGGFIPHDWLFRQVRAVVHHGGAGTTAAGILAGRPTLVIPFGGDQPFWGNRMHQLGIGPKPIPRERLTVSKLSKALTLLITTKSYSVAAKELGIRLRMEEGPVIAANIIEKELRKWRRIEGLSEDIVPTAASEKQEIVQ